MVSGPKRASGTRSDAYSESKSTNWMPFDPYWSEAKAARPAGRPAASLTRAGALRLPIYERTTREGFVATCTAKEVLRVLESIPPVFLRGLSAVFLLAGTRKQLKSERLFRYGTYASKTIYLHAFPASLMKQEFSRLSPARVRAFERAGATVAMGDGRTVVTFDTDSLSRFYLTDVLLHEVGHHVDSRVFSRPSRDAESFADWFAEEQARLGAAKDA